MKATDLDASVWNAIADLIGRSQAEREVHFCIVARRDLVKKLIWVEEYGEVPIPLVSFNYSFTYWDTQPTGNTTTVGTAVNKTDQRRGDLTHLGVNPEFLVRIIVPKLKQMVVIIDPAGSGRFPFCVGVIQSRDYWEK